MTRDWLSFDHCGHIDSRHPFLFSRHSRRFARCRGDVAEVLGGSGLRKPDILASSYPPSAIGPIISISLQCIAMGEVWLTVSCRVLAASSAFLWMFVAIYELTVIIILFIIHNQHQLEWLDLYRAYLRASVCLPCFEDQCLCFEEVSMVEFM